MNYTITFEIYYVYNKKHKYVNYFKDDVIKKYNPYSRKIKFFVIDNKSFKDKFGKKTENSCYLNIICTRPFTDIVYEDLIEIEYCNKFFDDIYLDELLKLERQYFVPAPEFIKFIIDPWERKWYRKLF